MSGIAAQRLRRHSRYRQSLDNSMRLDGTLVQMADGSVMKMMLNNWIEKYFNERIDYHSASLFCMTKMREIDHLTVPLGRVNSVKTAINLDLLEYIVESVRPRSLRQILCLLRNEMLMSIYEGPIRHVRPRLMHLIDMNAYFNQYPSLRQSVGSIQRRISEAHITPGEFRDFESRKIFVINYQTKRYAQRLLTIVFRTWHFGVVSSKRMTAKLKRFFICGSPKRTEKLNHSLLFNSWQRWRIVRIQRLNDRNESSAIEAEQAGDLVDVQHGIAYHELSQIQERLNVANTDVTTIKVAVKARQLHRSRLLAVVAKLGPNFAFYSHLIGSMKRLISHQFVVHLNRHLAWLEVAVRQRNFLGLHHGPNISPSTYIQRRLQARAAPLSLLDVSGNDALNRIGTLLEGDSCFMIRLIQLQRLDSTVTKTLLMNALLPVPLMTSIPSLTFPDPFQDVPGVQLYHDTINWASSQKSDLSSPSTKCTLSQIPETLSLIRFANISEWESFGDLMRFQNDILCSACLELIACIYRWQQQQQQQQQKSIYDQDLVKTENAPEIQLAALLVFESEIDIHNACKSVQQRSKPIRQWFHQGISAVDGGPTTSSMSWFEFSDLIRNWRIFKTGICSYQSLLTHASQIWVDVQRRSGALSPTVGKSATISKPKAPEEYLLNDIDELQWQAILVRITEILPGKPMPISEALDLILLDANLNEPSPVSDPVSWLAKVKRPAVRNMFSQHRALLISMFLHYCKQPSRNPMNLAKMELQHLQQFWIQNKLNDIGLTWSDATMIFNQIVFPEADSSCAENDKEGLLFSQFCQAIACFSCFHPHSRYPFLTLEERINTLISKHLRPLHKTK